VHDGDVFDQSVNRLLGTDEQAMNVVETTEVCSWAPMLTVIPAHSCSGPVDADEDNLILDYKLAPGAYYVFPERGTDPEPFKQGLMITVCEP
jgi:hypothetical protein